MAKGMVLNMKFRKLGKLDWQVSALGFGCMRLPTVGNYPAGENIIEEEAVKMIRYGIDNGVNYVDSAYLYHQGNSEIVLGKALRDGYRDRVKLATKAPMQRIKTAADYDRILDEQLKKLQVDKIDFYLFHGLNKNNWEIVKSQDLIGRAEAARQAGKIGHICFSFHDRYEVFEEIVNAYDGWTLCQIQYNFMDTENQAGAKGLQLAASKGIGVAIMEPLLGGKLANPPGDVQQLIKDSGYNGSAADLALQWLWNQPEVSVVLSGMTTMEQVVENIRSANKSGTGSLPKDSLQLVEKIKAIYQERTAIACTGCSYCMPCPNSVNIPRNLKLYNDGLIYDYFEESKRQYNVFTPVETRAGSCIQCRICEEKCPQKIAISEWMPKIHTQLVLQS